MEAIKDQNMLKYAHYLNNLDTAQIIQWHPTESVTVS